MMSRSITVDTPQAGNTSTKNKLSRESIIVSCHWGRSSSAVRKCGWTACQKVSDTGCLPARKTMNDTHHSRKTICSWLHLHIELAVFRLDMDIKSTSLTIRINRDDFRILYIDVWFDGDWQIQHIMQKSCQNIMMIHKQCLEDHIVLSRDELSQQYHAPFCLILVYHKSVDNASGIGRLSLTR